MAKKLAFLLFFCCCSYALFAQEYLTKVRHYNMEKGLETHDIRYMIKDSKGFMWFTSEMGAYRFDGYEFKSYKRKIKSFQPYGMDVLTEDEEGNLWFFHPGTRQPDLSILPEGEEDLVGYEDFFKDRLPFSPDNFHSVYFDNANGVWIKTKDKKLYEYSDGQFKKIFETALVAPNPLPKNSLLHLNLVKSEGPIRWVVYNHTLWKVNVDNGKIEEKDQLPKEYLKIYTNEKGQLFLFNRELAYLKENEDAPIKSFRGTEFLTDYSIMNISSYKVTGDNCVLAVKKGTASYDLKIIYLDGRIHNFEPFGLEEQSISPHSFFLENDETLWLTTHNGIFQIQFQEKQFNTYLSRANSREILKTPDGLTYVATHSGLFELDLEHKEKPIKLIEELNFGRGIYIDQADEFWLGGRGGKMVRFNPNKPIPNLQYRITPLGHGSLEINVIQRERKTQELLVGTTIGLYYYADELDRFLPYEKVNDFTAIHSCNISDIFENQELSLLATSIGVFEFDGDMGITNLYSTHSNTLPYDNITHIHQDKIDQTFWLATNYGGLIHWNKTTGETKVYTTEDGLSDNLIYAVYEDDLERLWLPSNAGLMRFDKNTQSVNTYTIDDGIAYNEFNFYSHYQDELGKLYLGGLSGITVFNPNKIVNKPQSAPLYLTGFEKQDSKTGRLTSDFSAFAKSQKITVEPQVKSLRLSFALLDYGKPEVNQFAYKINGYSEDWNILEDNSLFLNNLPFGNFDLLVRAKASSAQWSSQQLRIPIQVLKPFYLKWWFFALVSVFIAGLIRYFVKRRTDKLLSEKEKLEKEVARRTEEIKKQAEELKQLDEVKTRFFANVSHELRTPLTLIISPLKQLMKTEHLDDKTLQTLTAIAHSGDHLKTLVEEILDLSRYDANKLELNKKEVHFLAEVRKWASGFHLEAQHRGINFQLYYQLPIDIQLTVDAKKLAKITLNLLSNAFKHTKKGDEITLQISEETDKIWLQVIDTGDGIHPNDLPRVFERFYQSKHTDNILHGGLGIGLSLSKELASLMDGKLLAQSVLGEGSTFTLIFPKEVAAPVIAIKENVGIVSTKKSNTPEPKAKLANSTLNDQSKKNVLIVEDHEQMRIFIQQLLSPTNNTFLASNGRDALIFLKTSKVHIDLIVSDIMMPEMDGFTFLDYLKKEKQWQLTPVIMLTARADMGDKLKAITIGVDDYLIKPFEPEELIARVNSLLLNVELRKKQAVPVGVLEPSIELEEVESADLMWLKELEKIAFQNIANPNFNVLQLANDMAISERQLHRKLKSIAGMSPGNYLNEIKLQKARHLLEQKAYSTVAEIAYAVGFSTPKYFSSIFKKRFGRLPSDFL